MKLKSKDIAEQVDIDEEHPKTDQVKIIEKVKDLNFFRNLVDINTNLLNDLSKTWTKTNESSKHIMPDDMQGDSFSMCLAKLLIDERFAQFNDLVHLAEVFTQSLLLSPSKRDTGITVLMTSDLEGFWEIIEIQVKHVQKKFIYRKM